MSPNTSERRIESLIRQLSAEASEDQLDALSQQLFAALEVANVLSVLQSLAEKPFLLEWILSSFPRQASLRAWIEHLFPKDAVTFKGSFIGQLVMRLSTFFLLQHDLPVPSEYSLLPDADKLVGKGPYSLDLLSQMTFLEETSQDSFVKPKVKSKRKGHKKSTSHSQEEATGRKFDPSFLSEFELEIPRNTIERDRAVSVVLSCMKNCLTLYLVVLGNVHVAEEIKSRFLSQMSPTNQGYGQSECVTLEAADRSSNFIQPFNTARHFSNVEGFGDWRILISTRADGDLREASRKNRKMFKIYMKKIKELSNGHFSPDNHKRLTGLNNEVPVYEAKMTSDTRLVYQVDCVADYDSEAETQVVRIFGIYTHAQMDDRLWHSVGSQLAKKGKEYRKRCAYRQRANSGESDLYMPATFPQPPEVEQTPQAIPELPPDDLDQIHSLLVLEKYLDFSHELLQSILADLDVSFPFQVSPHEKEIIEHSDSCYVLGRSGTGKTTTMLFKMLWVEKTYEVNKDGMPRPRQIFVTKSRVLARKVEESFAKLLASLRIEAKPLRELQTLLRHDPENKSDDLVDVDDEVNWRSDLPKRFSDLQDHHFPLFVTFDHLCDLIEGDADNLPSPNLSSSAGDSVPSISFEHFRYQYWPHFPQSLTKGLDPALVFSEIIGIIKGSEETLSTDGILSRKAYEGLSERGYSTFASQRSIVYSIFEAYQAQKRQRGERDNADRTHTLLQTIQVNGVRGRKIDQLYVDEAQDNLLIDALVLRSLSHNANGLFWAGDTAQTISVGSSFRFDDLKAFLFRIERQRNNVDKLRTNQANNLKPPKAFQLVTNYRSHGGIVNCAHSVIELISAYWPYSIDNLQPEKGIVDGPRPLFLIGWDNDNMRYEQFLFGASGSQIEFGAQQCILVRDEAARARLQEQVGEIGLIMTLYESKGLEFNDVLLFNFFEDSSCDLSQWRLILNEVTNKSNSTVAPRFEPLRHAPICFELKSLYVALTRARKNLWIADSSSKADPMRMYWSSRKQVQTCNSGDRIPQLAVASSPEEWASKGQELFRRKRYLQAKHCFDRARQPWEAAVSDAYLLREEARKVPVVANSKVALQKRQQSFYKAAEAFMNCSRDASKNRSVYIVRAAECFEEAGDDLRAARAYLQAESFDNAAKLFRKLGRFDDAVQIIKNNSRRMNQQIVDTITDVARLYYIREEQFHKARNLFANDEEELDYLEDLDLNVARADVLVSLGRYHEAAKLHVSENRTMSAIPLFLREPNSRESAREAGAALLQELWKNVSIGQPETSQAAIKTLVPWLEAVKLEEQDHENARELSMFKTLFTGKQPSIHLYQHIEELLHADNRTAALVCLDHNFTTFPDTKLQNQNELASTLAMFLHYIRLLRDIALRPYAYDIKVIVKLFGCQPSAGETYLVPKGTLLYIHLSQISEQLPTSDICVSKAELYIALHDALGQRIREKVAQQSEACKKSTQFSTCLNYAVSGSCNRFSCPSEHISTTSLTPHWYTTKVRLHLLQILIHHIYYLHLIGGDELKRDRRIMLNQLHESLFPPFYALGTLRHLLPSAIPEWSRGIQVVTDWVQELACTLDLRASSPFTLSQLFTGVRLGFCFDYAKAFTYLIPSRSLAVRLMIEPFMRPYGPSLAWEIILSTGLRQPNSLSAGILVLQHIVARRLTIQAGMLCDYVESLSRSIIISHRLQLGHGLHGLTLPWSWAPHCISNAMLVTMQLQRPLLFMLIDQVAVLLEVIYSGEGAEFLLHGGGNLASIPSIHVRGVFLVRLIRAICILGYNISNTGLRVNIVRAIGSLRRTDRRFHFLYRQFVECRLWDDLVRALRGLSYSPLSDHLIQLHDRRRGPNHKSPIGVTTLIFKDEDDLQHQLFGQIPAESAEPLHDAARDPTAYIIEASSEPPSIHDHISEGPVEVEHLQELHSISNEEEEANQGHDLIMPDATMHDAGHVDTKPPDDDSEPSEEEIKAATIIQVFYRTAVQKRGRRNLRGLEAARERIYLKCFEHVQTAEWSGPSRYRHMFLGPLPHILLSLEMMSAAISAQKSTVMKRLLSGSHQELDAIGPQMTQLQTAFKALKSLEKVLEPRSTLHGRQDTAELRRRVKECHDRFRSLPIPLPQEVTGDLALGVKGIVTEWKLKILARPKPSLVIDDDFDIMP